LFLMGPGKLERMSMLPFAARILPHCEGRLAKADFALSHRAGERVRETAP